LLVLGIMKTRCMVCAQEDLFVGKKVQLRPARNGMTAVIGGHEIFFLVSIDLTPLRLAFMGFMSFFWF
jgi:hypothetical protein